MLGTGDQVFVKSSKRDGPPYVTSVDKLKYNYNRNGIVKVKARVQW